MKPKTHPLKFLLSLVMAIVAIGLTACHNDDNDLGPDVYQGYIQDKYTGIKDRFTGSDIFTIRITKSPFDSKSNVPRYDDLISVSYDDISYLDLKSNRKVIFRIESAQAQIIPCYGDPRDYISWHCKIIILKFD